MAVTDHKAFPARSEAFRLHFRIDDIADGNPLTGGLTGLAGEISKDDAAFGATTNTPVEIGTTGYGYIDLTTAEMDFDGGIVNISATNAGAVQFGKSIVTDAVNEFDWTDYGDEAGRSPLTLRKQVAQIWRYLFNKNLVSRADGLQYVYKDDDTESMMDGFVSSNDTETKRHKMS